MAEIRKASVSDVQMLLPLVKEYWRFDAITGYESSRVAAQLKRFLSEPSLGEGWISMSDKVAVGYLFGVFVFSLEHYGVTAEIDEFFVLSSHRGLGIGTELLKSAESEFRQRGCTNVSLQLSQCNSASRAFYRNHQYDERPGFELLEKGLNDD